MVAMEISKIIFLSQFQIVKLDQLEAGRYTELS